MIIALLTWLSIPMFGILLLCTLEGIFCVIINKIENGSADLKESFHLLLTASNTPLTTIGILLGCAVASSISIFRYITKVKKRMNYYKQRLLQYESVPNYEEFD